MLLLALVGSCRAIRSFTRFSGEVFGALIALLFLQVGVKVSQEEESVRKSGVGACMGA